MTLMIATWVVSSVVIVAVVVVLVVRSRRPRPLDPDWREDVAKGEIKLVGGPGWATAASGTEQTSATSGSRGGRTGAVS